MKREDLYDLAAFAVVAEKASFTRAAAELGMTQSALSHAIKLLEERIGISVAVANDSFRLRHGCGRAAPAVARTSSRGDFSRCRRGRRTRGKASGSLRITATKHAVSSALMPVLPGFLEGEP